MWGDRAAQDTEAAWKRYFWRLFWETFQGENMPDGSVGPR